jgi:hypothetical protein
MDLLERFPRAWCDTCQKMQPVILGVMGADDKNDHDAADIACEECKSILVTLHAPEAVKTAAR